MTKGLFTTQEGIILLDLIDRDLSRYNSYILDPGSIGGFSSDVLDLIKTKMENLKSARQKIQETFL